MDMYLMNNIDHIQYNYFPIDNQRLDWLHRISNNVHTYTKRKAKYTNLIDMNTMNTIDISNFLLVLGRVVVWDNKYDMKYHNHHKEEVCLRLSFYHSIRKQYNRDSANLYRK